MRKLWPGWRWFVTPSGGPYAQTGVWGVAVRVKNVPLVAHPVGAALVVLVFARALDATVLVALAAALLAEGVNQFYKATAGVYGGSLWANVLWRMALALLGGGAVLLL